MVSDFISAEDTRTTFGPEGNAFAMNLQSSFDICQH
jgi:hypothetical protein